MQLKANRLVVIGLSALLVLPACSAEDPSTSDADVESSAICRNWTEDEFDKARDELGDDDKTTLMASYAANRCSTTVGSSIALYGTQYWLDEPEDYPSDVVPVFLEDYLTAEGVFAAWSTIIQSDDVKSPEEIHRSIQDTLGRLLARGTDPQLDSALSDDYRDELIKVASDDFQLQTYSKVTAELTYDPKWELEEQGPTVYGWSVLAPLLRFGDYHEDFLTPIATEIIGFDQKHDGDWTVKGEKAMSFDAFDDKAGTEMAAVLEALSRNDTAAAQVAEATGDERVEELLQ